MDFYFKMMGFVLNTMGFALKMMDFDRAQETDHGARGVDQEDQSRYQKLRS